jgi:glycosyltransferase involved in cell wall biosynthesis
MHNRFVIITTCYNVDPYVRMNFYMNKFQSYENALFVYVDDKSKDSTLDTLTTLASGDDRFLILQNSNNGSQGKAYMYAIEYLETSNLLTDNDIIVEVDGDDWLSSHFVLAYLNNIYQDENVWMTYGHYQEYPSGNLGGHFHMHIHPDSDAQNIHRFRPFPYSHLKTYKYWLFNKINRDQLIDPVTGEIFAFAWDHALCLPMVEMAGKQHIYRCEDILYILNRHPDLQNESKVKFDEQKQTELRIRSMPVYKRL